MLSNRESAVVHLRAENGHILDNFNIVSRHYVQITEENCLSNSEALELSHKLERLHQTVTVQSHNVIKTMNIETGNWY